PGGGGPGGQTGQTGAGARPTPQSVLDQRRYDPNFRLPPNAPLAHPDDIETWVSPNGRDLVTRGPDGIYRFEAGTHGGRGGQNAGHPRERDGWRRISALETAPAPIGGLNALLG